MNYVDNSTKLSTACGTLLTIFVYIQKDEIIKTIILAGIGAITSFAISLLLKYCIKRINRKK